MQDLAQLWNDLGIKPAWFDLVTLQLESERVEAIPGRLVGIKNHPFLQGNGLRGIQSLESGVLELDEGTLTNEEYLGALGTIVGLMEDLLADDPQPESIVSLNEQLEILKKFQNLRASAIGSESELEQAPDEKRKKMIGDYLVELGHVSEAEIETAFTQQSQGLHPGKRLGDILQDTGIITRAQLDEAIEMQMVDQMEA